MNILEAMDDPELFGTHFDDVRRDGAPGTSWDAWRAALAAIFALSMSEAEMETFRRHTGLQTPPTEPYEEVALICGRRGGKSRIMAFVATYLATCRDYAPYLAPGEVATVAVMASDRRQARTIFNYVKGAFERIDLLKGMVMEETKEQLVLNNRVNIEIGTASMRSTRGYAYAAVLADEVAHWRTEETSANPDEEILDAIRPGLSSIPGSILILASSPYGRKGALWKAYREHYSQEGAPVLVWKASTFEMNPNRNARAEAKAYKDDPQKATAEWGGNFRDDVASFVTPEVVDACTMKGCYELPPLSRHSYSAFVDPSGGSGGDSFTLAIAHSEGERGVLDAVREIKPPFSPESAVMDLVETLKLYGIYRITGDWYGGEWPSERFRVHGITYDRSEKNKNDLYREVLPLLNSGQVDLLDIERLQKQLLGLERRTARGGRDSIDHAPREHDDVANAVAGALVAVAGKLSGIALWEKLALAISTLSLLPSPSC